MRTAHIVTTPHQVGDRVLALCGKEHKVKTTWEHIPPEAPICRDCVDVAVLTLDEADVVIIRSRRAWRRATNWLEILGETLNPEDLGLDVISDTAIQYANRRAEKQQEKADREKAQRTCTCDWDSGGGRYTDPDCPIHGGDLPPVAPPIEQAIE